MEKELRTPPANPVDWTIAHRDGRVETRKARTAWIAAEILGWSFMNCIHFEQGPDE